MKVTMAHGSGGESTSGLIKNVFAKYFNTPLSSAIVMIPDQRLIIPNNIIPNSTALLLPSKIALVTCYILPFINPKIIPIINIPVHT